MTSVPATNGVDPVPGEIAALTRRGEGGEWVAIIHRDGRSPKRQEIGGDGDVLNLRSALHDAVHPDLPVHAQPPIDPRDVAAPRRAFTARRKRHLDTPDRSWPVEVFRHGTPDAVLVLQPRTAAHLLVSIDDNLKAEANTASRLPDNHAAMRCTIGPSLDRDVSILEERPGTPDASEAVGRLSVSLREAGRQLCLRSDLDEAALDLASAAASGENVPLLVVDVADALARVARWARDNRVFLGERIERYAQAESTST